MALFRFFKGKHPYEEEFVSQYQESGATIMVIAAALGALVILAFYFLDWASPRSEMGWWGGVQTIRLLVASALGGMAVLGVTKPSVVRDNYRLLANLAYGAGVQAAVYIAYSSRVGGPAADVFWALNASTATATVIAFGGARLHSLNALCLSLLAACSAVAYSLTIDGAQPAYPGRLVVHLSTVIMVCYFLRREVEKREMHLFCRMKELRASEEHAKQLEEARAAAETAKSEAERADRSKSMFLAGMSHELRTPVNGLLQVLELVGQSASGENKRLIEAGQRSASGLMEVVNGILAYTANSSKRLESAEERVDLVEVFEVVRGLHAAAASAKGLALNAKADIPDELRMVCAGRMRLLEALNNLVGNAVKFTDSGRVDVDLTARACESGRVEMVASIRDTGIGIAAEQIPKVFTPFWQGARTLSTRRGGTGLGLAMVKKYVDDAGGQIEFGSVEEIGTRVVVKLQFKVAPLGEATVAVQAATPLLAPDGATPANRSDLSPDQTAAAAPRSSDSGSSPKPVPAAEPLTDLVQRGDKAANDQLAPAAPRAPALRGHVLVAEDNELNALTVVRQLHSLGLEVELATNGLEALNAFDRQRYDLILMDCQMPMLDGLEVARLIRAREGVNASLGRTPIIGWTAHLAEVQMADCFKAGMDDFIGKPYRLHEMAEKLARWLLATGAVPPMRLR